MPKTKKVRRATGCILVVTQKQRGVLIAPRLGGTGEYIKGAI